MKKKLLCLLLITIAATAFAQETSEVEVYFENELLNIGSASEGGFDGIATENSTQLGFTKELSDTVSLDAYVSNYFESAISGAGTFEFVENELAIGTMFNIAAADFLEVGLGLDLVNTVNPGSDVYTGIGLNTNFVFTIENAALEIALENSLDFMFSTGGYLITDCFAYGVNFAFGSLINDDLSLALYTEGEVENHHFAAYENGTLEGDIASENFTGFSYDPIEQVNVGIASAIFTATEGGETEAEYGVRASLAYQGDIAGVGINYIPVFGGVENAYHNVEVAFTIGL